MVWPEDFVNTVICGDCVEVIRQIPDNFIHCCVTSPPYWGLRDYKIDPTIWPGGWKGCLGLEPTPEMYIQHLVEIFREVKRVLRKDGTLWLNLGDSYAGSGCGTHDYRPLADISISKPKLYDGPRPQNKVPTGLKPKDLCGIPWRVALALQADGWYLRSDIIWSKPNPMPESVKDRPTRSHEYIFLLTKNKNYFFDQEAVREVANYDGRKDTLYKGGPKDMACGSHERWPGKLGNGSPGRNIRSVWTITTKPFKEAHFATFPPELPERCIKAGTSEKGVCPECGSPWVRIIKRIGGPQGDHTKKYPISGTTEAMQATGRTGRAGGSTLSAAYAEFGYPEINTIGWRPSCKCNAGESIPAIVCDPFAGAGTTGMVAKQLGRNYILIDIKPEYCEMARKRIGGAVYQMNLEGE